MAVSRWMLAVLGCGCLCAHALAAADVEAEEARQARRIAEVLGADANYLNNIFERYRNPDVNLEPWVKVGERLKYQAVWKGLPAGTIELAAKRLRRKRETTGLVVEMLAEPNDFLARTGLYGEKTKTQSYIDLATGHSCYYRREQNEYERRIRTETLEFDVAKGQAYWWRAKPPKRKGDGDDIKDEVYGIRGQVQDALSIFYYARGLALDKVGDARSVILAGNRAVNVLTLTVVGEEAVTVPGLGRFDCVVVEPTGDEKLDIDNFIDTKGGARIWLERHSKVPVMLQVEMRFGVVTANLIEVEHSALTRHALR